MEMHLDKNDDLRILQVGDTWIKVLQEKYDTPIQISNKEVKSLKDKNLSLDDLSIDTECIQEIIKCKPAVVLLGVGKKFTTPNYQLQIELNKHGIGLETMDTTAASRTFNVLVGEDRHVIALLF